ncbi:hypothetical protein [Catenuloplanes indicus]|uniref:Uncharacterized protein n=1 Tax=Catenuloplanes indicus TaxID=137267 RepID=A0AAE3VWT7_9ACTN|nr:hypothetical protein [Catenuloplanes indicus]MDQ0364732.1 hypothetical protein [Catenuloplanes indicus]
MTSPELPTHVERPPANRREELTNSEQKAFSEWMLERKHAAAWSRLEKAGTLTSLFGTLTSTIGSLPNLPGKVGPAVSAAGSGLSAFTDIPTVARGAQQWLSGKRKPTAHEIITAANFFVQVAKFGMDVKLATIVSAETKETAASTLEWIKNGAQIGSVLLAFGQAGTAPTEAKAYGANPALGDVLDAARQNSIARHQNVSGSGPSLDGNEQVFQMSDMTPPGTRYSQSPNLNTNGSAPSH